MKSSSLAGLIAITLLASVPVSAHHSFAAEYDANKPITVVGEVVQLEWTNPHARVTVEGKDETGRMNKWDFELGPPTVLMRRGWGRNSLKPGTMVTVQGFRAKDEPNTANARNVTLADGRQVFVGSSFDPEKPATP